MIAKPFYTLPCLLGVLTLLGAAQSSAQADYPSRPIRLVVTSTAGGTGDTLARAVSRLAAKPVGRPGIMFGPRSDGHAAGPSRA